MTTLKAPTGPGWWARRYSGRTTFVFIEVVSETDGGDTSLVVWNEAVGSFVAARNYCQPGARWAGPIPIPWGT